jgi:hypothetical protein
VTRIANLRTAATFTCLAIDNETLLVNACESLASASMMLSEFAGLMDMPHRNMMLGIQSVVMLGELAVNRVLDNLDPRG